MSALLETGPLPPIPAVITIADIRFIEQGTRTYTYNANGGIATMVLSLTNPAKNSTFTYTYDASGNLLSVAATGDFVRTETFSYNADGTLAGITVT